MAIDHPIISPKKLIEVALPLDAINIACAREKSIRHGHPSTLHLWWARRPLAAARAVIFSQLVNDPEDLWRCQNPGIEPNKQVKGHWTKARARLFQIIEEIVLWENTTNEVVMERARGELRKSWIDVCELNKDHPQVAELFDPNRMPGLHDPFAGGGTIPLEAQRLGLDAYASDLNPVAVLINKAMIEIPPMFSRCAPVHPRHSDGKLDIAMEWRGVRGLAEDVRYYGQWISDEAEKTIGQLYPKLVVTPQIVAERPDVQSYLGRSLNVVAWLWVRTVRSPNPAFSHVDVPLASTFVLSNKTGKEAYVQPIVSETGYEFKVKVGVPPDLASEGTKASRGNFRCLMSGVPMDGNYLRSEAQAGRMGQKLMAIVVEGNRNRIYLPSTSEHESIARSAQPEWKPDVEFFQDALGFRVGNYGMSKWSDLFTRRQLVALTTFSDLVIKARARVQFDAQLAGMAGTNESLESMGSGPRAYAEAVSIFLGLGVSKLADSCNAFVSWKPSMDQAIHLFTKQAIPMVWDFAEPCVFSKSMGDLTVTLGNIARVLDASTASGAGKVEQASAQLQKRSNLNFVSTDPPYYDNIGYADLSDFFYVWLRRSLREVYPSLLSTISVPKAEELVATAGRHGSKANAEKFFLDGMSLAVRNLSAQAHPASPITIYYAFKQSDTASEGTNSTGWETFLDALLKAGLSITGTWPMRTELGNRSRSMDSNALASSIILVCRPRSADIGVVSRRQFIRQLNETLPVALDAMTRESEGMYSPIAPVDLSQAIIGPGMAIFSTYESVLEADGSPMTVRTALQLINRFLAEDDFDPDSQFCLHWFDHYGWESGKFGEADTLARAKGTSVDGVKNSGVLHSASGNVRLLKWSEYPSNWDPKTDGRLPIWEVLHQLIRVFNTDGESGAALVFAAVQSKAEAARQLAYRLYTLCERKNWAEDARAYNEVVTSWTGIESAAAKEPVPVQGNLFDK